MSTFVNRWCEHEENITAREVKSDLKVAKAQLWCLHRDYVRGIWVTREESTDRCTWGVVWGCAGALADVKEDALAIYGIIEAWFRMRGCAFVEIIGRDGWERILPDYQRHAVVLRKWL